MPPNYELLPDLSLTQERDVAANVYFGHGHEPNSTWQIWMGRARRHSPPYLSRDLPLCNKVDVGELSALPLVTALMCKVGVEFFRTLRVVDEEVLADADIRRVEDVWVVVAEVWVIELIVGPAGPCNTCIGCGGGDNGQLGEDRLMVGDVIGGGEVGISMIGLVLCIGRDDSTTVGHRRTHRKERTGYRDSYAEQDECRLCLVSGYSPGGHFEDNLTLYIMAIKS
uniref:Uncharacterized protein n=1 Tax=Glossina austeni TaxID=7395 RepID=A0A1A9VAP4_GLOAU